MDNQAGMGIGIWLPSSSRSGTEHNCKRHHRGNAMKKIMHKIIYKFRVWLAIILYDIGEWMEDTARKSERKQLKKFQIKKYKLKNLD